MRRHENCTKKAFFKYKPECIGLKEEIGKRLSYWLNLWLKYLKV
jgi:hypothetical protein